MKTKKSIALLLCLLLTLTLFVPSSTAFAVDGDSSADKGMKVSKTATANADGSYTITLEAYATGSKIISEVKKDIPTDIVLVLDQSGSMDSSMPTETFAEYTNETNSNYYANKDNLWYLLPDGSYVAVTVSLTNVEETPVEYTGQLNSTYYDEQNELRYLQNGVYEKVTVDRSYSIRNGRYNYTYKVDGTKVATGYDYWASGWTPHLEPSDVVFYKMSEDITNATYVYTYTVNGQTYTITTSKGSETICDETFYRRSVNNNSTRLNALSAAVTTFANSVATKAKGADGQLGTDDDINHRIAVVGFASKSGYDDNTELLSIAGSNSGSVGVKYSTNLSDQNYKDVLQDMDTTSGQQMVNNAIDALAANGATRTDLGLEMAKNILDKNPVQDNEKRNRVVIVFTDGAPTTYDGFDKSVANDAISEAADIKIGGTSVYSVGIFSGADATSSGTEPSGDLNNNSNQIPAASNWFMQKLSSNNGTPQTPSYYLSAADASTLNNIFKQISDQIESGGSSTKLTGEAVVKDIIAPQFTLLAGTTADNITLETYSFKGENQWVKNADAMGATATVNDNTVSVTGFNFSDNWCGTVTENGTPTYRGNKLVISFKVVPKDGFLGGNNVFTNTSAGIYENGSAATPVVTFDRPQVNVPIKQITVTAQDQNVYLLADVTVDALKEATTVKVGDVELDLTADNYGLEPWQNAYVNILPKVTYGNPDIEATDLTDLTDDVAYTVAVTVSPKEAATSTIGTAATSQSGLKTANIKVFKPVLTFQDSKADYLSEYPNGSFTLNNYVSEVWKHGETLSTGENVVMIGTKPELELIYTPDANSIDTNNKIIATDDFAVNVRVNYVTGKGEDGTVTDSELIELQHVTFNHHQPCSAGSGCGWNYEDSHVGNVDAPEFLIHVENVVADLKITKTGLDVYAYGGDVDRECAIITVTVVDGNISTVYKIALSNECSTATIKDLKVGSRYTISEDNDWTWRYKNGVITGGVVDKEGNRVIDKTSSSNVVTITNGPDNPYWLGGDNYCVNEFASEQATTD